MLVGTSQIDITPLPGVELSGFAKRPQPSDHVLDPLFVRMLYIDDEGLRILLINLDLIGVEGSFVQRIRSELKFYFDIPEKQIQIFATHTHSGPGTVHLNFCGEYTSDYLDFMINKISQGCDLVMKNPEPCKVEFHEDWLELGRYRRSGSNKPLTNRLGLISWRKADNELKAVMVNYAMHPVCMAGTGISADYPGKVCSRMEDELPGNPTVLFALGAAGDIDPPGVGASVEQMAECGSKIADRAIFLINKKGLELSSKLKFITKTIYIPTRSMSLAEIDQYADKYLSDQKWNYEFGGVFSLAVNKWRKDMKNQFTGMAERTKKIELSCLMIGQAALLFVNAELFSEFVNLLRSKIDAPVMIISCANGLEGYLPDRNEYEKGGYEIETAIFFFNSFLPEEGSLEILARESLELVKSVIGINK